MSLELLRINFLFKMYYLAVCLNGEIRLTGGRSNLEGRVEVCVDGRWETISDDGWGVNEATVVCRQLNYNRTGRWIYTCFWFIFLF